MYSSSDLRVVLLALNLMMTLLINCLLFTGKEVIYFLGSLSLPLFVRISFSVTVSFAVPPFF
jgi:hypothetical protein